jgi:hypothetical protein
LTQLRYVFDLDLTLCSHSAKGYEHAKPLKNRIQVVNQLYDEGHHLTIFTARGMSTFGGVKLFAKVRWRGTTRRQLKAWGVRYHKLVLGKPAGDVYVDDKGVLADDFFRGKVDQWAAS